MSACSHRTAGARVPGRCCVIVAVAVILSIFATRQAIDKGLGCRGTRGHHGRGQDTHGQGSRQRHVP